MQPDAIVKGYAGTPFGQIHFRRVAGPGLPVVLLHRTPIASESFVTMLRLLAGTRAAIALDTPGFGQSFRPAASNPSTEDYATWFMAALDALEIAEFHLCGHHTGTHFAAEMALRAPHRVRSVLLNGVLFGDRKERAAMRVAIGTARKVDSQGGYVMATWNLLRKLYPGIDDGIVHAELLGALGAIEGRDQAFSAILNQEFGAILTGISIPVAVVQAVDDPLGFMLNRVRAARPFMSVEMLGPARTAAPELQAEAYTASLLQFVTRLDTDSPKGKSMQDRRAQLHKSSSGFDLEIQRVERPTPGPSQVLVKIRATSLNRRDLMIRDLSYPVFGADHFTPLSDGAGEIVEVGSRVTQFAVGDRVCSTFFQHWPGGRLTLPAVMSALGSGGPGVLADYVVLAESGVAHLPPDWSFEEGAAISCAALTAWSAFNASGGIQPGDWVLLIGTGGVAIFALQIAVAKGANVVVLSSSDAKLAHARALGAHVTINYRTHPEWDKAVRDATGGGVQHTLELGGEGTLERSLASTAIGGHIALIGALAGFGGNIPGATLIGNSLRVSAITVGSHEEHRALTDFLVAHQIHPVIDSMFEFDAVADAYDKAAKGAFGKVVIRL